MGMLLSNQPTNLTVGTEKGSKESTFWMSMGMLLSNQPTNLTVGTEKGSKESTFWMSMGTHILPVRKYISSPRIRCCNADHAIIFVTFFKRNSLVILYVSWTMASQLVSYSYHDTSQLEHAYWRALSQPEARFSISLCASVLTCTLNNPLGSTLGIICLFRESR